MKGPEQIKAEIQSLGVRISPGMEGGGRYRRGGAGPAEGITLVLDGTPASVPVYSSFVSQSPYRLEGAKGRLLLCRRGEEVELPVEIPPEPDFYRRTTAEGIAYHRIALLHGIDCLASTVLQSCTYWGSERACAFCGIGLSLAAGRTLPRKDPRRLAEVAVAARRWGARHVTLTAGTTEGRELESRLLLEAARAVRDAAGLPVHVQLMPPVSRDRLMELREARVETIGIHRESFDEAVLERVAPAKAAVPAAAYFEAWEEAVEVFGRNQVSSFLLMGLGESVGGLLEGCERLAALGVYPYLVPFRPIPGTPLAGRLPLAPAAAKERYREAALVLEAHGLDWREVRAGCVRCRGCSALPDFQDALALRRRGEVRCVVVRSGALLRDSFAIRHEVFVREQGLFETTDRDEFDPVSFHILALKAGTCVGTVRITPVGEGQWLGSRLAVRPGARGEVGAALVKRAEVEVRKRKGRRFRAYVQASRVRFFERCGWRALRGVPDYHGRPHVLMEAAGSLWRESSPARPGQGISEGMEGVPRRVGAGISG